MTLWESAKWAKCNTCGRSAKLWSPGKAGAKGESTFNSDLGGVPYIDPEFKGYENTCADCRGEDIRARYKMRSIASYESKGEPVPEWLKES